VTGVYDLSVPQLFLTLLAQRKGSLNFMNMPVTPEDLQQTMVKCIETILDLSYHAGVREPCSLNFAVSDGKYVVSFPSLAFLIFVSYSQIAAL